MKAKAYSFFPKYTLSVVSGPDVWVVVEERRALRRSCLLPRQEGFRSPLAPVFWPSIGTWESAPVLGEGCGERVVRSGSQHHITMATGFWWPAFVNFRGNFRPKSFRKTSTYLSGALKKLAIGNSPGPPPFL